MKTKKQCQDCNSWKNIDDLKGFCKSKKRKEQRTIPVTSDFITIFSLPGCDFWEERYLIIHKTTAVGPISL